MSFEGWEGLFNLREKCTKNPGHENFIPIREFSKNHLPSRYRYQDMEDMVRAIADITVRVSHFYISPERPAMFLNTEMRFPFYEQRGQYRLVVGTGFICHVKKFTEFENIKCRCDECRELNADRLVWGHIRVYTASHVVYDQAEANDTTCHVFDVDVGQDCVLTLTGLRVRLNVADKDFCLLEGITHDVEIVSKLEQKIHRFYEHQFKVHDRNNSRKFRKHPLTVNLTPNLDTTVAFTPDSVQLVSVGK